MRITFSKIDEHLVDHFLQERSLNMCSVWGLIKVRIRLTKLPQSGGFVVGE